MGESGAAMNGLADTTELRAPKRLLVLGDIMLDRYTWGWAERVSPEAPVLVVRAESCEVRLGGGRRGGGAVARAGGRGATGRSRR